MRTDPDITHIDIDESPDEAQEPDVPEQPSQNEETPKAATEAAVEPPPESIEIKEKKSHPSKPLVFTGSIADWARLKKSSPVEPKHGESPPRYYSQNVYTHIFMIWELSSQLHRTSVTQGVLAGMFLCNWALAQGTFCGRANYTH